MQDSGMKMGDLHWQIGYDTSLEFTHIGDFKCP
jgi:hypothetical protein